MMSEGERENLILMLEAQKHALSGLDRDRHEHFISGLRLSRGKSVDEVKALVWGLRTALNE